MKSLAMSFYGLVVILSTLVTAQEGEQLEEPELAFALYQKNTSESRRLDRDIEMDRWEGTGCAHVHEMVGFSLVFGSAKTKRSDRSPKGPVKQDYCIFASTRDDCSDVQDMYAVYPEVYGEEQTIPFERGWTSVGIKKGGCVFGLKFEPNTPDIIWQP